MTVTKGWAVCDDRDVIDVKTISDTRRAAIVNWLVAGPPRKMIYNSDNDDKIENLWQWYSNVHLVRVIEVRIKVVVRIEEET